MAQHALAVSIGQASPLFGVGGLECTDELVQDSLQILRSGENAGTAVDVHRAIVPGGDVFAGDVVRGGYVGVGAVEDRHARRMHFEMAPVWIRFGHVATDQEATFLLVDEDGKVRGEGAVVRDRDQDRERIRAHKRNSIGVVVHSEVFGNVHVVFFLSPLRGLFKLWRLFPTAYAPSEASGQAVGCTLSPLRGWAVCNSLGILSFFRTWISFSTAATTSPDSSFTST